MTYPKAALAPGSDVSGGGAPRVVKVTTTTSNKQRCIRLGLQLQRGA